MTKQQKDTPLHASDVVILNFAKVPLPVFREVRGGAYVRYGTNNLYPEYLLEMFDTGTKHGAIVAGKAFYVAGKGWRIKGGAADPTASAFIAKVNKHGESLAEVTRKAALDEVIFGGYYLQIIWGNLSRTIAEVYHIDFNRIRSNKDNTQFYYQESWERPFKKGYNNARVFPAFNPSNPRGSQILMYKAYRPGVKTYPLPEYARTLNYVGAEVEVSKHTYGNAKTGFSPSISITYTNGEPSPDEKKKITEKYEQRFTGADGKKFILNFVDRPEKKPLFDQLGASDLTKEDFSAVDDQINSNLYSGHSVTTPALFGISTPGALGQRTELRDGYEIFKNTYVNSKQQQAETVFNRIARYAGLAATLEIEPTEPIGIDLASVSSFAPKAWLLEQIGVDPTKYPETQAGTQGQPGQQMSAETPALNEALRKLTGRQHQQLFRVINQYKKGKITEEQAKVMLGSGYGLTPEEITQMLGSSAIAMAAVFADKSEEQDWDIDFVISVFAEFGKPAKEYSVIKTKRVKYRDEVEAEMREHEYLTFAAGQLTELQSSILDLLNKDKLITPEVMANTLAVDLSEINTALKVLEKADAIKVSTDKSGQDVRELTKPLKELKGNTPKVKSFNVMYSYEGPQDSKNRPFCAKMMELGRYYTRVEIEKISARLGYSVWDRRGGFYHNPSTGETTPWCRHDWVSHIVMSKQ